MGLNNDIEYFDDIEFLKKRLETLSGDLKCIEDDILKNDNKLKNFIVVCGVTIFVILVFNYFGKNDTATLIAYTYIPLCLCFVGGAYNEGVGLDAEKRCIKSKLSELITKLGLLKKDDGTEIEQHKNKQLSDMRRKRAKSIELRVYDLKKSMKRFINNFWLLFAFLIFVEIVLFLLPSIKEVTPNSTQIISIIIAPVIISGMIYYMQSYISFKQREDNLEKEKFDIFMHIYEFSELNDEDKKMFINFI